MSPKPLTPAEKTLHVHQVLDTFYGHLEIKSRRTRMHELISTMLSHRTNHANETLAYSQMLTRFGDWEGVRAAPFEELAATLRPAQFPEPKAANIQKTLQRIKDERGEIDIDFLEKLPVQEAMEWLTSLPGVGLKTATLVLLFSFQMPVLPVDTHVHRVCQRIGILGPKDSAEKAHSILLNWLPKDAEELFNFHKHLFWHGQRICTWSSPKCPECPVRDVCVYFQTVVAPKLPKGSL
jgi:endonuclease III